MSDCTANQFSLESERMLSKHRYDGQEKKSRCKKSDNMNLFTEDNNGENAGGAQGENILESLWEQERHRYVFDPFDSTINFNLWV